ncbi:hypothetical protein ACFFWD_21090 [Bradyrhizobium erythrophlei]
MFPPADLVFQLRALAQQQELRGRAVASGLLELIHGRAQLA